MLQDKQALYTVQADGEITSRDPRSKWVLSAPIVLLVLGLACVLHAVAVLLDLDGFRPAQITKAYFMLPAGIVAVLFSVAMLRSGQMGSHKFYASQHGLELIGADSYQFVGWADVEQFEADWLGAALITKFPPSAQGIAKAWLAPFYPPGGSAKEFAAFLNALKAKAASNLDLTPRSA